MSGPEQEFFDSAFGVTPDERRMLRHGRVPRRLMSRLRSVSWEPVGFRVTALTALAAAVGAAALRQRWALVLPIVLGVLAYAGLCLRELLHERRVWNTRPVIRTLEGRAETRRTWQYGYGDAYVLWCRLEFAEPQANEPSRDDQETPGREAVTAFEKLGKHVVTGWLRAYVVTVPSRRRRMSPWFEELVALETGEAEVSVREIEPANAPPTRPLRVDVPAD